MEEKKTIFNYLGQVFSTYGVIVVIFTIFGNFIGEVAKPYSTLFAFGREGISFHTLEQLLGLAILLSLLEIILMTDGIIKRMSIVLRFVCFFTSTILIIVLFAKVFSWFPMDDVKAWIGFFVSYVICTVISVVITLMKEKSENQKMAQALERLKKE